MIRRAILTPGTTVNCPRCGTRLRSHAHLGTKARRLRVVWLFCDTCKRNLTVRGTSPDGSGS